jgi:hypothetical protein
MKFVEKSTNTIGMDKQFQASSERKILMTGQRVNLTIPSMRVVDAWKVWSLITFNDVGNLIETQK